MRNTIQLPKRLHRQRIPRHECVGRCAPNCLSAVAHFYRWLMTTCLVGRPHDQKQKQHFSFSFTPVILFQLIISSIYASFIQVLIAHFRYRVTFTPLSNNQSLVLVEKSHETACRSICVQWGGTYEQQVN